MIDERQHRRRNNIQLVGTRRSEPHGRWEHRPSRAMSKCALLIFLAAVMGGCASRLPPPPGSPDSPRSATGATGDPAGKAPEPRYNLTGYSDAFKSGYADACANDRRRDEQRFKSDNDYRMGWTDGSAICKRR